MRQQGLDLKELHPFEEPVEAKPNPLLEEMDFTGSPSYTDTNDGRYITAAKAKLSEFTGGDMPRFSETMESIAIGNKQVMLDMLKQQSLTGLGGAIVSSLTDDTPEEDIEDAAMAIQSLTAEPDKAPAITHYVNAISLAPTFVEKRAIEVEWASEIARQAMESQGGFEAFLRGAQMFVPFANLIDTVDITGANIIGNTKVMINNYQRMPWEDKITKLPIIFAGLLEKVDGDEGKAVREMMRLVMGEDGRKLDLFLDTVDIAAVAYPFLKLAKSGSVVKTARNVSNYDEAGRLNNTALKGGDETFEATNTTQEVAALNTSPFKWESYVPEATDGIAAETVNTVTGLRLQTQSILGELEDVPLRHIFRPDVEANIQSKAKGAFAEDLKRLYGKDRAVSEAEIVASDEFGFTVSAVVRVDDANIGVKRYIRYTKDEASELDSVVADDIKGTLNSPEVWMNKVFNGSVDEATLVGLTEGHALDVLQRAAKTALPKNKASAAKLDAVLLQGDDIGETFTMRQLKDGIETPKGVIALTDEEIGSYYAQRDLFDTLFELKNKQLASRRAFEGGVGVSVKSKKSNYTLAAQPTESWGTARTVYNSATKKPMGVATANKLFKEGGYKRVFLDAPVDFGGDVGKLTAALVPEGAIRAFPKRVLQYSKGYVPRNWEGVFYAARKSVPVLRNGEKFSEYQTVRFFDNKTEASAYVNNWKAKNPEGNMEYVFKDERPVAEVDQDVIKSFGGLYGTSRNDRKVLMGMNGDEPVRVSAIKAMDANINHIATAMPLNNFRMGMQATWEKSAKKFLENPRDPMNSNFLPSTPAQTEVALRRSRDWIKDQMRIPSEAERRWGTVTRSIGEWMEGKPLIGGELRKWTLEIGAKDPFANLRAGAFHAMLGWFNPAQLLVQAQSASVALSLHPTMAPRILPQVFRLRAGINSHMNPEAIAKIAKASGMNVDEYAKLVSDYNKSGLQQSLKSTADYAAATLGNGLSSGALSRSADKGLVFFREGESFGRMYSWLVSREKWLKSGKKIATQKDIDAITTDSVRMTMNLHRANRAHWQKGVLSVPTQFWQINAKFVENLMPTVIGTGKWTGVEKSKVLMGQLMLYGGAGVPLAGLIDQGISAMQGDDYEMSAEELELRRNGVIGWMQELMFDDVLQGSGRLGLGGGLKDLAVSISEMGNGEMPEMKKAFGAFGAAGGRMFTAIGELAPYLNPSLDLDFTPVEAELAVTALTDVISSFNNFHTATIWYRMRKATDKNGNALFDLDDTDSALIIGKALGLQPDRMNEVFELSTYNRERKRMVSKTTEAVLSEYNKLFTMVDIKNPANKKNFDTKIAILLSALTQYDQNQVMRNVHERWNNGDSAESRNLQAAFETYWQTEGNTGFQGGNRSLDTNKTFKVGN